MKCEDCLKEFLVKSASWEYIDKEAEESLDDN